MRPQGMRTTSVDLSRSLVAHRRIESDNDSAISLSMDNAGLEKQQHLSTPSRPITPESAWRRPKIRHTLREICLFCLPSFLSDRFRDDLQRSKRQKGVTSLNGLRGIAILVVLNEQLTYNFDNAFLFAYGYNGRKAASQWPLVRFFFSSPAMTYIIFCISGYVICHKALRQIHCGNVSDAQRSLSSSALRRVFRLYVPTLVATAFVGLLTWLRIFDRARNVYNAENNQWMLHEPSPPRYTSLGHQTQDVLSRMYGLLNAWTDTTDVGPYNPHSWTIPVLFRNSMITITILQALSRLRTKYRLYATSMVISVCVLMRSKHIVLFLFGFLLADIDQIRLARLRYISLTPKSHREKSRLLQLTGPSSLLHPVLFATGIALCSIPEVGAPQDPVYKYLHDLVPTTFPHQAEWIRRCGAIMIMWTVANSSILTPIFNNRMLNYFGNISFAIFLVHSTILRAVLHACIPTMYHVFSGGAQTNLGPGWTTLAWMCGFLLCMPLIVWTADVFWRGVEIPSVRAAKWLEEQLCENEDEFGGPIRKRWTD